jgi:energy-coupling factor transporter transmembrane protein EcfT
MSRIKKIILISVISIFSVILLFLFMLYNFPYDAVIKRADLYLTDNYSMSLRVQKTRYRYPVKLLLEDVRVTNEDGSLAIHIDNVLLRLKVLNFSKSKTAELTGSGIYFKSDFMDMSDARVNISVGFGLSRLRKEKSLDAADYFSLKMEGAKVDRVFLTGFEFSKFKIPVADVFLVKNEGNFVTCSHRR